MAAEGSRQNPRTVVQGPQAGDQRSQARNQGPRAGLVAAREGALAPVLRNARRLGRLQEVVRSVLPADLAEQVHVVGLASGHLRVLVSSSMRATELRYQQRRILAALAEEANAGGRQASVRHIDISVRPPVPPPIDSGRSRRPLGISAAAARQIGEAARAEPDPDLRRALERLSGRQR